MTTQVAAGLGWPARPSGSDHRPAPDSLVPERPASGLGWPDRRGVVAPAEWADVLVPSRATRPQPTAASHEAVSMSAKVDDVVDEVATGSSVSVAPMSPATELPASSATSSRRASDSVVARDTDPTLSGSADPALSPAAATVSRETGSATDPTLGGPGADPTVEPEAVSRETADGSDSLAGGHRAAEEATPLADAVGEPHDTPIAQAAATAVRVLGGRYGSPMPRPAVTRVMTVANQKGGVGKTTSTVNLAAALALHGAEVLVVDLDPQGNASTALGVDHHSDVPSVYDVLIEGRPVDEVVTEVEGLKGLSCVPATIDLAGAEIELVSVVARESRLKKALDAYATYRAERGQARLDYVLVDCPPSLGLLTVNALVAAEEVLIPIQCEYYALEGLGQLIRNVDLVKAHLNPALHVSTILLTMYDARTRLAAQVADEVRAHFTETVLRTTIPRSVRISEAPSYGQTVLTYDPASTGALSYLEAAREMAVRGAGPDPKETTT